MDNLEPDAFAIIRQGVLAFLFGISAYEGSPTRKGSETRDWSPSHLFHRL